LVTRLGNKIVESYQSASAESGRLER